MKVNVNSNDRGNRSYVSPSVRVIGFEPEQLLCASIECLREDSSMTFGSDANGSSNVKIW